ncbi:LTA synthase family protein [Eubacteriaceae bacterium ES3]|nr:LTA synthase family protein [Eubacteriaceae bacterium ES3]
MKDRGNNMDPFLKPIELPDADKSKLRLIWILIYPLLICFLTEWIQRDSIYSLTLWIQERSVNFYLNYLLVLALLLLFVGLFSKIWIASLFSGLIPLCFAMINSFKLNFRDEPLLPWDIFLSKEAFSIHSNLELKLEPRHFLIFIIFFGILIIPFYLRKSDLLVSRNRKLLITGFSLALIFSLFHFIFLNTGNLNTLNIYDKSWNQTLNYEENGFLTGFMINSKNIIIEKPDNYSYASVETVLENYPGEKIMASISSKNSADTEPNIILIMNESLFDPTQLQNVSFSTSPVSHISAMHEGNLFVSQYGGGTANTEFEVLTGNKTLYLPAGSVAYQQYIKDEIPALPSFLKEYGYTTVAVHPYNSWFWNRDTVYPNLGFDSFIGMDEFENPEIAGNLISDQSAVNRVIEEFEDNQNTNNPFFCFLVTMQNHCGYEDKNYANYDVSVSSDSLDKDSLNILNNYVQGVYDADAAYGAITDYFKTIDEPTVIVMFGDHLPGLGDGYDLYQDLGFINNDELAGEDYLNLYSTPISVYSNTELIDLKDLGLVDANLLGIEILDRCGFTLPSYWSFLIDQQQDFNQNNFITINSDGTVVEGISAETEDFNRQQWLVEYDILFGENFNNTVN